MRKKKELKFLILLLLLAALFTIDLKSGSSRIDIVAGITDLLTGKETNESSILLQLRLPKAITAILAGAALSASGALMQTTFYNPLAGPYVLGVSSGASLGVALFTLLSAFLGFNTYHLGNWGISLAAIAGAMTVMIAILIISKSIKSSTTLLIIGVLFGSVAGSIINLLQGISNPDSLKLFISWTLGSLDTTTVSQLKILIPSVFICLIASFCLSKPLDALLLGEEYATAIGISVKQVRNTSIAITSILVGLITAFSGPIGFIGIAVPHLTRSLFNSSKHTIVIPGCILCGANLLLMCDILSHLPQNGYILPINAICAIIGAPIVTYIILKPRKQ